MCGICAFIGYAENVENTGSQMVFDGLKMLLNRGYDSTGVCGITSKNTFQINKYASTPEMDSFELLDKHRDEYNNIDILISHSRWAVTGIKSGPNSHPHIDYKNRFAIVHNGIIENYLDIKKELLKKGVTFNSQTDTEVIVNLISVIYDECHNVEHALHQAFERLEGTWGIVLISTETPNKMYCARHGSPLLIGFGDNFMMVASEQSGFYNNVNNYICLNDHDIVVLEKANGNVSFSKKHEYSVRNVTTGVITLTPDPYPHWTLKEINEQDEAVLRSICLGGRIENNTTVRLGGLTSYKSQLIDIDNLIILGCGTSYNAGLHVSHTFKKMSGFNIVQVFDGAEFNEYDLPLIGKTALMFISQSGETRDLIRCIDIGKNKNLLMIGIINVVDSYIAREVHCGVYLNAGREVAVASTKAFSTQVVVLHMIAVWFAQIRKINNIMRQSIIRDIRRLPLDIKQIINESNDISREIASYLSDKHSLFILGKGLSESIAKEGSLKIKEIGYIHSEAYSSSALKHGPFSILGNNTPVILLSFNDHNFSKNQGVCEEIKARDSYVIGISDIKLNEKYDRQIIVPKNETFRELLAVMPMQLIAYHISLAKGMDPDKPANLAKVVTV